MTKGEKVTALFKVKYDCKGSRRYGTDDEEFPIGDIYVKRPFANDQEELEITILVK